MIVRPTVDAWVRESFPNTNYGAGAYLQLNGGTSGDDRRAYLHFKRPFPLGATVTSAVLRLYCRGSWSGSQNVLVRRVTEAWRENGITWANQPATTAANEVTQAANGKADQDVLEVDITALMQAVSGGGAWYGLRLALSANVNRLFYSSDFPLAELHPELELAYEIAPFPPTSLSPAEGVVSKASPVVRWHFSDPGSGGPSASQVQVGPDTDFPSGVALGISSGGLLGHPSYNDARIAAELDDIVAMGGSLVVGDIPWSNIEAVEGTYDFTWPDRWIVPAYERGLTPIPALSYSPNWITGYSSDKTGPTTSDDRAAYAAAAAAIAERYPFLRYLRIWNEPNLGGFWAPSANVANYGALLDAAYAAIKAVRPDLQVIACGLAGAATSGGDIDPGEFLEDLLAANRDFDALDLHIYAWDAGGDNPEAPDTVMRTFKFPYGYGWLGDTTSMRSQLVAAGRGATPIMVLETGMNDVPDAARAPEVAAWFAKLGEFAAYVTHAGWYTWNVSGDPRNITDGSLDPLLTHAALVDVFTEQGYDSGKRPNVLDQWSLQGEHVVPPSVQRYWRVRVWDDTDLASEWSDAVPFTYEPLPTLTIDSPGATVDETTPPISWTFTGTQTAVRIALWEVLASGELLEQWLLDRLPYVQDSYTLPAGILKEGRTYRVEVKVWGEADEERQFTPGAPDAATEVQEFEYVRSGAPTSPTSLTAQIVGPAIRLEWQRATMPDYFALVVDGELVHDRLDPSDLFVSGTTYRYDWLGSTAGVEHTLEVEAVVSTAGGPYQHSDSNPEVEATREQFGIYLADEADGTWVFLAGKAPADFRIGESGQTHELPHRREPVRITDNLRGYEGAVAGNVETPEERDTFNALKGRLKPLRLLIGSLNIPVLLEEASVAQHPSPGGGYDITVGVRQCGPPWPMVVAGD